MGVSKVSQYLDYISSHDVFTFQARLELLNPNETVYGDITADIVSGTIKIVRANGVRRTCKLVLTNLQGDYIPDPKNVMWINQKFKLHVGLILNDGTELLFPQGVYIITNPKLTSYTKKNEITINGVDKFGNLNGKTGRGKILYTHQIDPGSNPMTAIYDTLKLENFYDPITPMLETNTTPTAYTIKTKSNSHIADTLLEINNIYSWNMYYDEEGRFTWRSDIDDDDKASVFDFDDNKNFYLGSTYEPKYTETFNVVKVISENATDEVTYSSKRENRNLSSPSCIQRIGERPADEIRDNAIFSDDLADLRALYELKRFTALGSKCSIKCFPLYHLDVDQVVTYSDPNFDFDYERFVITAIDIPLSPKKEMKLTVVRTVELIQGEFTPTVAPLAVTFSPIDGDTNRPHTGGKLQIIFDQNVYGDSGKVTLYKTSDDSQVEQWDGTDFAINGAHVSIDISTTLEFLTSYYVLIDGTAFKNIGDLYYAGLSNKTDWDFTTEREVLISSTDPTDDEINVAIGSDLEITFNQDVTGDVGYVKLYNDSDVLIEQWQANTLIIVESVVSIPITGNLSYNTNYYVQIDSNAFKNINSTYFAGISDKTTWNFTSELEMLISSTDPADDEVDVALDTNLEITFNQNIIGDSGKVTLFGNEEHNIMPDPQFDDDGNWGVDGGSISFASNIMTLTGDGTKANPASAYQDTGIPAQDGHLIFASVSLRQTVAGLNPIYRMWLTTTGAGAAVRINADQTPTDDNWMLVSGIGTTPTGVSGNYGTDIRFVYTDATEANGAETEHLGQGNSRWFMIDLTERYGAGNEPTLEQCRGMYAANAISNGQFDDGTTDWIPNGTVLSVSDNIMTHTGDGTILSPRVYQDTDTVAVNNNKVYLKTRMRVTNSNCTYLRLKLDGTTGGTQTTVASQASPDINNWYNLSGIMTPTDFTGNYRVFIMHYYATLGDATGIAEIDGTGNYGVFLVDLTEIFGAGSEPDLATCDTIFENVFSPYIDSWTGSDFTIVNEVATINPANDLLISSKYHVEIANTAFKNSNNQYFVGFDDSDTWNFETAATYTENMAQFYAVPGTSNRARLKVQFPASGDADGVMLRHKTTAWGSGDDETSGTLIATITDDSSYKDANEWYEVSGLTNGNRVYFKAFPYKGSVYNTTIGANESSCKAGGLVHEYHMDSISGSTVNDTAGSQNGTASNLSYVSGKVANAGDFNGTSSSINCGTPTDFNRTNKVLSGNGWAYEVWVYISAWGTNITDGSKNFIDDRHGCICGVWTVGTGIISGIKYTGSYELTSKSGLSLNTWYHCVYNIYDDYTSELFVDGISADFNTNTTTPTNFSLRIEIGSNQDSSTYGDGNIDQVRFYSRVLESYEITSLYNSGNGC